MPLPMPRFPRRAVSVPLRLMPFGLQRSVVERVINRAFAAQIDAGELDFLKNRMISLEVSDLGWCWPVTLAAGRVLVCPRSVVPATRIRADTGALFQIAVGETDPDTLFFQRRLVVEGDTELGLALKNFLQASESSSPLLRFAMRMGRRVAAGAGANAA